MYRIVKEIEYAADSTIPELIASPTDGLRWIEPVRHNSSPIQLMVRGVLMLPKINRKNNVENTGMYCTRPR